MNIDYQALEQFKILLEYPVLITTIVVGIIMFFVSRWIFKVEDKGN